MCTPLALETASSLGAIEHMETRVLRQSNYLGGDNQVTQGVGDGGAGITVDSFGMIYITGTTGSANFPVTPGAFLTTYPADACHYGTSRRCPTAFVPKLNPRA